MNDVVQLDVLPAINCLLIALFGCHLLLLLLLAGFDTHDHRTGSDPESPYAVVLLALALSV